MNGKQKLSRGLVALMAVTAGLAVANIYYCQPILKDMAASLGVGEEAVGNIPLLTQVGYGLGLFFIVPLGDKLDKKRLILSLLLLLAVALLATCFVATLGPMLLCSLLIGILSVSPQVVLPMAAALDKENRGKTIGTIYTGLLVGILGARVFSGLVAEYIGWRYVFGLSAVLVAALAALLQVFLPVVRHEFGGHYGHLLRSTLQQVGRFPLLRRSALLGGLVFGVFCSFWTTLTFHLGGPPFHYGPDIIGLFGLVAIAGALVAPVFGKKVDKGDSRRSLLLSVALLVAGVLVLKFFPTNLAAFVLAVVLLDVGVQATHVTNVARIYTLDDRSLSRINTVYLTSYFLGGALGTFFGVQCWKIGGWSLVTAQMLLWSLVAAAVVASEKKGAANEQGP
ncbi:MFS transporter [Paraflavisolibacter sp. H34]